MSTHISQVTVASGQSVSGNVRLRGQVMVVGVVINASTWTTADVTFQGSTDGTTFYNLYDGSDEYAITAVANTAHKVDPVIFKPWNWIRVRSGTGASAVNQAGDRTISILVSENF